MKTVFKSSEISHVWANKLAPFGRSPSNLSFSGDAILSYATVIGRRIQHNGREAYILDRYFFSSSTVKSQSAVWQAIDDKAKVFHVSAGKRGQSLNWTSQDLAKHYTDKANELEAAMPSRYAFKRAEQYNEVTSYLKKALDVCQYFGLGSKKLVKAIEARQAGEADAADTLKGYRQNKIDAEKARKIKEAKEKLARNLKAVKEYVAKGECLRNHVELVGKEAILDTLPEGLRAQFVALVAKNNATLAAHKQAERAKEVNEWLAGKGDTLPSDYPTLLRAEENEMVTSRGARVPLDAAKRTYIFIQAKRAKGWHRNGETHSIGGYELESVNESGVIVGCHRVTWEEIERFAASQGWAN